MAILSASALKKRPDIFSPADSTVQREDKEEKQVLIYQRSHVNGGWGGERRNVFHHREPNLGLSAI